MQVFKLIAVPVLVIGLLLLILEITNLSIGELVLE